MAPMRHVPAFVNFIGFIWAQTDQPAIRYFTLKDPDPEPSFVWFILNTFFFIGVILAVTIAIGVAFGGFPLLAVVEIPQQPLQRRRQRRSSHNVPPQRLNLPDPLRGAFNKKIGVRPLFSS